jgi:hypothetical protein
MPHLGAGEPSGPGTTFLFFVASVGTQPYHSAVITLIPTRFRTHRAGRFSSVDTS